MVIRQTAVSTNPANKNELAIRRYLLISVLENNLAPLAGTAFPHSISIYKLPYLIKQ